MDRIEEYKIGDRVDKTVTEYLKEDERFSEFSITRSGIASVIPLAAHVNGGTIKRSYKLRDGDVLEIETGTILRFLEDKIKEEDKLSAIVAQKGGLDIVFEDKDILVLNKPKGLVVHPGVGNVDRTLANYVRGYLEEKGEYDMQVKRAGIVHRLDKEVSGLIILAKNRKTQLTLKEEFENHRVKKLYIATVTQLKNLPVQEDVPVLDRDFKAAIEALRVVDYDGEKVGMYKVEGRIVRDSVDRQRMLFKLGAQGRGKYALSYLVKFKDGKLLIKIETGRMHQIRATLRYLGWVILGDQKYGYSGDKKEGSGIELESSYLSLLVNGQEMEWII